MTLFVSNIRFFTTQDELKEWFNDHGHYPERVQLVTNKNTGESRGFAFVDFSLREFGEACVQELNERFLHDRKIFIREAEAREPKKK
jgi:RNA recognition motif-containing protein